MGMIWVCKEMESELRGTVVVLQQEPSGMTWKWLDVARKNV